MIRRPAPPPKKFLLKLVLFSAEDTGSVAYGAWVRIAPRTLPDNNKNIGGSAVLCTVTSGDWRRPVAVMTTRIFQFSLAVFLFLTAGEERTAEATDSGWLDIEQLSQIKVTSVSKKPETLSLTPASIHVITQEDMHRSGVTSIPEALRLAPGMQVGRVGSASWAISSRGFMSPFADRMLVLADGRSVYDPFFSGVYWDTQDYLLEDLARIEVIRGPGGTIWGANAVNGVVNIISKPAGETQGLLLSAGGQRGTRLRRGALWRQTGGSRPPAGLRQVRQPR